MSMAARELATAAVFTSSRALVLLDHFRVPYTVASAHADRGLEELEASSGARRLIWPRGLGGVQPVCASIVEASGQRGIPVFTRLLPVGEIDAVLARLGGSWTPVRALRGPLGQELGALWRREDGSVFLPFDPDEVLLTYWSERYLAIQSGPAPPWLRPVLMAAYYGARPLLGRHVQIFLRRQFARLQARARFPRWPVETCLHDFCDLMLGILCEVAGEPVPSIAAWPDDHTWALVVTHDVEQASGIAGIEAVVDVERAHGMRSSWNLVPGRYAVSPQLVQGLQRDGFEIGVHGLYHDGRDLRQDATRAKRLPAMREAADRWSATGFRSPALHRRWDWMPQLGFDYDSSYPDTDPFEPQPGGCCTWLPFFNRNMVELPITLVQDHTLFVILGQHDETAWMEKARFLRERGGMALINTHPDYLVDARIFRAYARFLDEFAHDPSAWRALPRDVSAWWRRRAASLPIRRDGRWTIVGPAASAGRVEFLGGSW